MKYVQLKKLFHVNEAQCNELYQKRFNSESTRKLGIYLNNGYECFYQINEEVLYLIDRIYTINTWLEKTMASDAIPSLAKEYLVVRSLVEEIKSSNQMEGIYSTRKELKDMLIAKDIKKYKRFYGMVNKYKKLWKDNFKELKTVHEIRELYDEVLLQDVIEECKTDKPDGVLFRKDSVEINSGTKVIHNGITGEENIVIMCVPGDLSKDRIQTVTKDAKGNYKLTSLSAVGYSYVNEEQKQEDKENVSPENTVGENEASQKENVDDPEKGVSYWKKKRPPKKDVNN